MKFLMKVAIISGLIGVIGYARSSFPKLNDNETPVLPRIAVFSRSDMESAFETLDDIMARYGFVTIADLYDTVGFKASYLDEKFGWDNLKSISYTMDGEEYVLNMPPVIPWKRPSKTISK